MIYPHHVAYTAYISNSVAAFTVCEENLWRLSFFFYLFVQLVDLKAALFRKQQEYKKEKSTSLGVVQSSLSSSAVAAPAHDATESAGRKVSDKVSIASR